MRRADLTATALRLACAAAGLLAGCDGAGPGLGPAFPGAAGLPVSGEYTIRLRTFSGPDHVQQAQQYKQRTEQYAKWTDLFIVHEDSYSALYWGRYPSPQAAEADLRRALAYRTPLNVPVFSRAAVAVVPGQQTENEPWKLTNAKGAYSVLVAVFFDMPDRNYLGRKEFALDYCRRLREAGLEAYYYHETSRSGVTVGAFPASSVEEVDQPGGQTHSTIRDPAIHKVLRDFPELAVNGSAERVRVFNPQTQRAEWVTQRSYVIRIPRKAAGDDGQTDRPGDAQPR